MLTTAAKFFLTCTALAPALVVYALVYALNYEFVASAILTCISAVLVLGCWSLLRHVRRRAETENFRVTAVEIADGDSISFLLLYLIPLITGGSPRLDLTVWIPALLVFGLAVAKSYSYHFNPILGFFGWHFYKVTNVEGVTYVLISKKQIRNVSKSIVVCQLTEYILIEPEGE